MGSSAVRAGASFAAWGWEVLSVLKEIFCNLNKGNRISCEIFSYVILVHVLLISICQCQENAALPPKIYIYTYIEIGLGRAVMWERKCAMLLKAKPVLLVYAS